MQHCTLIRAKREALTKAPAYVSVRHTDNDKSASIFIIVAQALVAPLRPSQSSGKVYHLWKPLGGITIAPQKKECNIALPVTPQKADKMADAVLVLFSPLSYLII